MMRGRNRLPAGTLETKVIGRWFFAVAKTESRRLSVTFRLWMRPATAGGNFSRRHHWRVVSDYRPDATDVPMFCGVPAAIALDALRFREEVARRNEKLARSAAQRRPDPGAAP